MKLTQSQLKQIVKEEISKTLNEVNLPFWFVKVGHDTVRVPKEQAGGLKLETPVQALEWAILNRLNHPEINRKMKKRIVDFVAAFYTVGDLETGKQHEKIEVSDSFLETNKDLLDKYGSTLEERNNTKITESQLRKIIKEELKAVRADQPYLTEGDFVTSSAEPDPASAAPGPRGQAAFKELRNAMLADSGKDISFARLNRDIGFAMGRGTTYEELYAKPEEEQRAIIQTALDGPKKAVREVDAKITESQLRKIIKEELSAFDQSYTDARQVRNELVNYFAALPGGQALVKSDAKLLDTLSAQVAAREMTLDKAKAKLSKSKGIEFEAPMEEAAGEEASPLRTVFQDGQISRAIADTKASRIARTIKEPTPDRIRAQLELMLSPEEIASYKGTEAFGERELKIRGAIKRYENTFTRSPRR